MGQDGRVKKLLKSLVAILVIGGLTYAAMHFTEGVQQERQRGRRGGADGPVPVIAIQARLADVPEVVRGINGALLRAEAKQKHRG